MGGSISSLTRAAAFRFPFDGALECGSWSPASTCDSESMGGLQSSLTKYLVSELGLALERCGWFLGMSTCSDSEGSVSSLTRYLAPWLESLNNAA